MLIHRSLSAHYHALIFQNARTFQNVKERGSEKMEKNQLADFQKTIKTKGPRTDLLTIN
jgi:hypothetical protein